MPAPTGTLTFDKAVYKPGDTITATVTYADASNASFTGTATLTAADGTATPVTGNFSVADAVSVVMTDSGNRTWTKVSDTGATAVFTATA